MWAAGSNSETNDQGHAAEHERSRFRDGGEDDDGQVGWDAGRVLLAEESGDVDAGTGIDDAEVRLDWTGDEGVEDHVHLGVVARVRDSLDRQQHAAERWFIRRRPETNQVGTVSLMRGTRRYSRTCPRT